MVLNASGISKPVQKPYAPYGYFTQQNVFNKNVLKLITLKQVDHQGLTLNQLKRIAQVFPIKVIAVHATSKINDLNLFRITAKKAFASDKQYIIVNFYRPNVDEVGAGHFSPLAAYDQKTDRFLLLDVARYKYPPVWVKASDLWKAMNTIDTGSHQTRGYLVISSN